MDYLSLCLMFKDENQYLEEWFLYHLLLGVERFYIYDNGSRINARETLRPYVEQGRVIVLDIAGKGAQLAAYDHFLKTFAKETFWAGFIDTDEFLVPKTCKDLRVFLQDYEKNAGLSVNWLIFGSNGHKTRPDGGQILNYAVRTPFEMPENQTVKSIVRPDTVIIPHSPHHFIYKEGYCCVNEQGYSNYDQVAPFSAERIQLNHYWCRSEEELEQKFSRGRGDGGTAYERKLFEYYNQQAIIEDKAILNLLQAKLSPGYDAVRQGNDSLEPDLSNWIDVARHQAPEIAKPVVPVDVKPAARFVQTREEIAAFHTYATRVCGAEKTSDIPALIKDFLELIELYPTDVQFYCGLADALMSSGDLENSWGVLAKAWKLAPNNYKILTYMGKYFHTAGQFEQSEKIYRLAEAQDPYGFRLLCWFARMYIDWGVYDRAFECIWRAVSSYPYSAKNADILDVIKKLGVYYYSKGRAAKVLEIFEIAVQKNPDDYDLLLNLGKIYFDAGEDRLAEQFLRQAVAVKPDDEEATLGLNLLERRKAVPVSAACV